MKVPTILRFFHNSPEARLSQFAAPGRYLSTQSRLIFSYFHMLMKTNADYRNSSAAPSTINVPQQSGMGWPLHTRANSVTRLIEVSRMVSVGGNSILVNLQETIFVPRCCEVHWRAVVGPHFITCIELKELITSKLVERSFLSMIECLFSLIN